MGGFPVSSAIRGCAPRGFDAASRPCSRDDAIQRVHAIYTHRRSARKLAQLAVHRLQIQPLRAVGAVVKLILVTMTLPSTLLVPLYARAT